MLLALQYPNGPQAVAQIPSIEEIEAELNETVNKSAHRDLDKFSGIWSDKDAKEFDKNTKDFEKVARFLSF